MYRGTAFRKYQDGGGGVEHMTVPLQEGTRVGGTVVVSESRDLGYRLTRIQEYEE